MSNFQFNTLKTDLLTYPNIPDELKEEKWNEVGNIGISINNSIPSIVGLEDWIEHKINNNVSVYVSGKSVILLEYFK